MSETSLDALYFHLLDERDRLRQGVGAADPVAGCYAREMLRADAHAELARRGLAAWSADVDQAVREAERAARKAGEFALGMRGQKPNLSRLDAALDVLGSRAQALREALDGSATAVRRPSPIDQARELQRAREFVEQRNRRLAREAEIRRALEAPAGRAAQSPTVRNLLALGKALCSCDAEVRTFRGPDDLEWVPLGARLEDAARRGDADGRRVLGAGRFAVSTLLLAYRGERETLAEQLREAGELPDLAGFGAWLPCVLSYVWHPYDTAFEGLPPVGLSSGDFDAFRAWFRPAPFSTLDPPLVTPAGLTQDGGAVAGAEDDTPQRHESAVAGGECGLELIPGGFAYRGQPQELSGQPLAMLRELLGSRYRRCFARDLVKVLVPDALAVDNPEQVVRDAATDLRAALKKAAADAGVPCKNPLKSSGKGEELAYLLNLP
jgi:hypothetical protein